MLYVLLGMPFQCRGAVALSFIQLAVMLVSVFSLVPSTCSLFSDLRPWPIHSSGLIDAIITVGKGAGHQFLAALS